MLKYFQREKWDGNPVVFCGVCARVVLPAKLLVRQGVWPVFICDDDMAAHHFDGFMVIGIDALANHREDNIILGSKVYFKLYQKALGISLDEMYSMSSLIEDPEQRLAYDEGIARFMERRGTGGGNMSKKIKNSRRIIPYKKERLAVNKLSVYYRISDKGNEKKQKLKRADKRTCLLNAVREFGAECFHIIADNCKAETVDFIREQGISFEETSLGNCGSFLYMAELILRKHQAEDAVYLLEDDYLHRRGSKAILLEGLALADYVSLYDHPDKYQRAWFRESYYETPLTRIYLSEHVHWRLEDATTMTFACRVQTLREDYPIWQKYAHPRTQSLDDYRAFMELTWNRASDMFYFLRRGFLPEFWILCKNILSRKKMKTLVSPIPSYATHAELQWLAPFIDWEQEEL
jgi:hypothetical protein